MPRKKKRMGKYVGWKPQFKKAIVTLLEGDTINLFTEN
jgi:large subunit ribosomal protein L23